MLGYGTEERKKKLIWIHFFNAPLSGQITQKAMRSVEEVDGGGAVSDEGGLDAQGGKQLDLEKNKKCKKLKGMN